MDAARPGGKVYFCLRQWAAMQTVMTLSAGAFRGQRMKLCDLSGLETGLFRSLYSDCVALMIALVRQVTPSPPLLLSFTSPSYHPYQSHCSCNW